MTEHCNVCGDTVSTPVYWSAETEAVCADCAIGLVKAEATVTRRQLQTVAEDRDRYRAALERIGEATFRPSAAMCEQIARGALRP